MDFGKRKLPGSLGFYHVLEGGKVKAHIIADSKFTVQPNDIDVSRHLFDSFAHYETEVSASWLVEFAQKRNQSWEPFITSSISIHLLSIASSTQR